MHCNNLHQISFAFHAIKRLLNRSSIDNFYSKCISFQSASLFINRFCLFDFNSDHFHWLNKNRQKNPKSVISSEHSEWKMKVCDKKGMSQNTPYQMHFCHLSFRASFCLVYYFIFQIYFKWLHSKNKYLMTNRSTRLKMFRD